MTRAQLDKLSLTCTCIYLEEAFDCYKSLSEEILTNSPEALECISEMNEIIDIMNERFPSDVPGFFGGAFKERYL